MSKIHPIIFKMTKNEKIIVLNLCKVGKLLQGNLVGLVGKAPNSFFKSVNIKERKMFYTSSWKLGALFFNIKILHRSVEKHLVTI